MERQCKIGGESAVYEDRISELPEALLLQILSSLQTETVIATSALSKRWRSLWKMVPKLKFDSYHHKSITGSKLWNLRRMEGEDHRFRFTENVYRSLLSHKAPVLESFRLVVRDKYEASDIGIWIGIGMAFSRHVRKLVLDLCYEEEGSVRFPSVLCSCNNTLEVLKLKGSILLDLPFRVCFKSLRELHLYYVEFKDEESVSNLLCGCPSLQDLVVRQNIDMVVETFSISVPSLQRLTIEDEHLIERDGGYVINAPSLKYLNIRGFNGLECCLIENAPELVEAKLTDISDITNEKILESLTSAKRLSLRISPLEMKYPTGIIFYQLLSLELSTYEREWWNLLSHMLDDSPQLQMLKLIGPRQGSDKDCLVDWKRIQPKCVPECLLFHLETFVWTTYDWQREDDKEVATYILKNARRLKKATISTEPIQSKELEKLEKRREMLNELASEVMASNSCHLVFEADTYSYKVGHTGRVDVPHKFSFTLGTTEKE